MGKKGTLTIPQHLRHELGLDGGTAVDLTPTGDGGLVIQKHRPTCNICQGTYEVVTFRGFQICRECFLGIREEVEKLGKTRRKSGPTRYGAMWTSTRPWRWRLTASSSGWTG